MDKYKLTTKGKSLMSKHGLAQELLEAGYEYGKTLNLEERDIAEVMITSSIQELVRLKGAQFARNYVDYELDSMSEKDVFEIQRGPGHS